MKTVVILQSNYVPWRGYFDLMHDADEFILYDDRQYTRQDWRNRNRIKTEHGPQWLTIPVVANFGQRIDETIVANPQWAAGHWARLAQAYRRAPFFKEYAGPIEAMYHSAAEEPNLSKINRLFLEGIGGLLGMRANLSWSTEYVTGEQEKTERLVQICKASHANRYVSGPAARDYLQCEAFEQAGIAVEFKDYSGYPEYPQVNGPFVAAVSVLDLLFNVGPDAPWYIWGWRDGAAKSA